MTRCHAVVSLGSRVSRSSPSSEVDMAIGGFLSPIKITEAQMITHLFRSSAFAFL